MAKLRRDCKKQGEMAELQFLAKASSLGFTVAKPYGDSSRYDFILDNGRRLVRVQVKSVSKLSSGGLYRLHACNGRKRVPFREDEIEALVAYVIPEDAWYVLPVKVLKGLDQFWVCPHIYRSKGRFERYRDAWHLLR